jgi:hypothetical protein
MHTPQIRTSRYASLASWIVAFALGGCAITGAQKAAIGQFGSAASNLGTTTSTKLPAMREDTIKLNVEPLVIGGECKDAKLANERNRLIIIYGIFNRSAGSCRAPFECDALRT